MVLGRSKSDIFECRRGTPIVEAGEGGQWDASTRFSVSWSIGSGSCSAILERLDDADADRDLR